MGPGPAHACPYPSSVLCLVCFMTVWQYLVFTTEVTSRDGHGRGRGRASSPAALSSTPARLQRRASPVRGPGGSSASPSRRRRGGQLGCGAAPGAAPAAAAPARLQRGSSTAPTWLLAPAPLRLRRGSSGGPTSRRRLRRGAVADESCVSLPLTHALTPQSRATRLGRTRWCVSSWTLGRSLGGRVAGPGGSASLVQC